MTKGHRVGGQSQWQDIIPPYSTPHLREVCQILATGMLRLRTRSGMVASSVNPQYGKSSLHFQLDPSSHAPRTNRRDA